MGDFATVSFQRLVHNGTKDFLFSLGELGLIYLLIVPPSNSNKIAIQDSKSHTKLLSSTQDEENQSEFINYLGKQKHIQD